MLTSETYITAKDYTQVGLPEGAIARLGKGGINVMKFSPDGTKLAIGTSIGVRLINVEDEKEMVLPTRNVRYFNTFAFSSDGKILASGGIINPGILIWDTETGNMISTISLQDYFYRVSELTFTNENKAIVGLGANRYITKWDINTGKELSQKEVYFTKPIHKFSPDGITFVSGHQENGEIRLWITESGFEGKNFQEKTDLSKVAPLPSFAIQNPDRRKNIAGILTLAYAPNKQTIVSAHNNHCIRIWDISSKTEIYTLLGHKEKINTVVYSSDSKLVASGSFDNTIHIWNLKEGKLKDVFIQQKNSINALAFSPTENELLASGSADGNVHFWDVNTGQQRSIFATGFTQSIRALAFTIDDDILVSAAENGSIQMWDVKKGIEMPFHVNRNYDKTVVAVLTKDASLFASRGADMKIEADGSGISMSISPQRETRLYKLPIATELFSTPHNTSALSISSNSKMIAIGNVDNTVLYDIESKEELHRFDSSHSFERNAIGFSPDNTLIAIGGEQGEINLWDLRTGEKHATLDDPFVSDASVLVFSRDRSTLAARYSGGIRFWDMKTHKQLHTTLAENVKVVDILTFSPDGKLLLTSKWNHDNGSEIQLWDVQAERALYKLTGHYEKIEVMEFSHDGKVLATGGKGGSILLWDWQRIIDKIGEENIGKLTDKESKTHDEKKLYTSKVEDAQAVMKWLVEQEYKLKKIVDKCEIAQGKSRIMMMDSRGDTLRMQNGKFEFSRDGILQINVKDVGMANFTFDEKGNLQYWQSNENDYSSD